jgi:coproporphyrinogen III oxidase-like Fe-S oxidoreductase
VNLERIISWVIRSTTARSFTFEGSGLIEPPEAPGRPVHLYVHIPFCFELCPYCSFHRVPFREDLARRYFASLKEELGMYRDRGYSFSGVYIGGGTPTVMPGELLSLLEVLGDSFSPSEISVETNPDRLDRNLLADLAAAGVKRVSVGVQTFDDGLLKAVGRYDKYGSSAVLRERLTEARGIVDTLNVDMIYNFPVQTKGMLDEDLRTLLDISPDQVTFYPLMISNLTRVKMRKIMGARGRATEKLFYEAITDALSGTYRPTSAWCFSKQGASMIDEYIVINDDYVGAGSGAFGLVGGGIYANTFSLEDYEVRIRRGMFPLSARKLFTRRELARYTFLMGLFGLTLDTGLFRERFGASVWQLLGPELLFFTLAGALRFEGSRIRLTRKGQYYWVAMMREFFTGVDNFRDYSREAAGMLVREETAGRLGQV